MHDAEEWAQTVIDAMRDDAAAIAAWQEERRAPAPLRYLEAVVESRGVPTLIARELVEQTRAEFADQPDTTDTWTALYYDAIGRADRWLSFGRPGGTP